ncbi:hypothetical protein SETIT_9G066800v2 [Setaria italica]|uniref:Uncharacterized protein n=1 Tax=Setaria italica TaxID=4555 RepID=A0A368SDR1_SETIT|nr:hypothetical protein SETIT_9G066800v2 [Setaria italica]
MLASPSWRLGGAPRRHPVPPATKPRRPLPSPPTGRRWWRPAAAPRHAPPSLPFLPHPAQNLSVSSPTATAGTGRFRPFRGRSRVFLHCICLSLHRICLSLRRIYDLLGGTSPLVVSSHAGWPWSPLRPQTAGWSCRRLPVAALTRVRGLSSTTGGRADALASAGSGLRVTPCARHGDGRRWAHHRHWVSRWSMAAIAGGGARAVLLSCGHLIADR